MLLNFLSKNKTREEIWQREVRLGLRLEALVRYVITGPCFDTRFFQNNK